MRRCRTPRRTRTNKRGFKRTVTLDPIKKHMLVRHPFGGEVGDWTRSGNGPRVCGVLLRTTVHRDASRHFASCAHRAGVSMRGPVSVMAVVCLECAVFELS